jgi:phosphocarrier protein HPr
MSDDSANCVRESVEIANKRGLHARASAKFVNTVTMLPESLMVTVFKDGAEAVGGSILGLMMLGAAKGDTIEICVTGDGADAALAKLVGLVKDRFGED